MAVFFRQTQLGKNFPEKNILIYNCFRSTFSELALGVYAGMLDHEDSDSSI